MSLLLMARFIMFTVRAIVLGNSYFCNLCQLSAILFQLYANSVRHINMKGNCEKRISKYQKYTCKMNSKKDTIIHGTLEEGYDFYITDNWNKKYHFKISTFSVPSGLLSEAIEVIDAKPENEPRIFHILSDFGADVEKSEMLLKAKIKK